MSNEQVDEIMNRVIPSDKYTYSIIFNKRAIYLAENLTESDWQLWVERNPRGALTSKELGLQESTISNKHIGIKRERGSR